MAGNTFGLPTVKEMGVWWGGVLVDTVTFDTTGHSPSDMGWEYYEYEVVAPGLGTRLLFKSIIAGSYGPALDDVSVELIPEPALGLAPAVAILAGYALRRRR